MSEPALPPAPPRTAVALPAGVWKPILLRGAVAGVFGLATAFWQQPSGLGASLATALYLVLTAAAVLWLRTALAAASKKVLTALAIEAAFLVLAGLLALVLHGPVTYGLAVGLGLLAAGATALVAGWHERKGSQLARDRLSTGAVMLSTGVILPFFIPMGSKALMGVVGGSAIILAVLLLLASLSYRHDELQSGGQAVN
ncbi:MAG: hypothetical protein M3017_08420 [Actinomycetota bacterium]|nr:hypothetical protein [Actinomycetota bacterium]